MPVRYLTVWFFAVALFGTGATLFCVEPPKPSRERPTQTEREKLRAEVITLRVECEMLRFDYENTRDGVLEELKMVRGLKMLPGLMNFGISLSSAMSGNNDKSPDEASKIETEEEQKNAAEAAKIAEQEEKKQAADLAKFTAEQKKELTRLFTLLTENVWILKTPSGNTARRRVEQRFDPDVFAVQIDVRGETPECHASIPTTVVISRQGPSWGGNRG